MYKKVGLMFSIILVLFMMISSAFATVPIAEPDIAADVRNCTIKYISFATALLLTVNLILSKIKASRNNTKMHVGTSILMIIGIIALLVIGTIFAMIKSTVTSSYYLTKINNISINRTSIIILIELTINLFLKRRALKKENKNVGLLTILVSIISIIFLIGMIIFINSRY